ncbi:MAG: phosphoribosylaminoimidazolesuccinocarboxamide synthase [Piscirickettsiaceae bacterium]|nr:phosphoribosylaminoimidazolesuccinocarboxamide synthase [Piscirickettsiaceae bacterium]
MKIKTGLYIGKAKSVYLTNNEDFVILRFRDDISAFDGKKVEQINCKGKINNKFSAFIMNFLENEGIPTHFERILNANESLVKHMKMMPIECVMRNIVSGSLCQRLGIEDGVTLSPPIFEFFLKNDSLHDPIINEYHIKTFGWAEAEHVDKMKELTFRVNELLNTLFADAGIILVDYKLEFGLFKGKVFLGDEFSPDSCRLWDKNTHKKFDKDRFRQGLGGVIKSYKEVARRIGVPL